MSSLLRDTARYQMLNLRLLVASAMLLFIGSGVAPEAGAQSRTTFRLIDQVAEPGAGTVPGDTLSSGARVAVLSRAASRAYALASLQETGHKDLEQEILGGSATTLLLIEEGRTPLQFERTKTSNRIYYVLAITGEGELLESYVQDDGRGGDFYPGFARVVSGDMVMGPVPTEHRELLRAALKSAMRPTVADTADGSQAGEDTAGTSSREEVQKRSESAGGTSGEESGGGYLQLFLAALYSRIGALLLGLLVGGLAVWWATYRKYRKKLSMRRQRIDSLKNRNHKLRKSNQDESKRFSFSNKKEKDSEKERKIKNLKREIRNKNEELNRKKEKIRKMREERGGVRDRKRKGGQSLQSKRTGNSSGRDRHSGSDASANRSSEKEPVDRTADLIGRAFVKWCKDAGAAMVDRHSMFAKRLKEGLPEADLQRIFREKNAAGIVFADDVQDAVEYWLVRVDGKDFLLPQPQRSGFREVEKCFQASCTSPKQLREFEPAELQSSGGKYELKSEGRLA